LHINLQLPLVERASQKSAQKPHRVGFTFAFKILAASIPRWSDVVTKRKYLGRPGGLLALAPLNTSVSGRATAGLKQLPASLPPFAPETIRLIH